MMNMDFNIDEDATVAKLARKARLAVVVYRALAEHIRPNAIPPEKKSPDWHFFAAQQIANILVLESCFRHGWPGSDDLAEYYKRLCRDRDEALRRLKIKNPYPVRSILQT